MLRSSSLHRSIHSCSDPYLSTVRSRAVKLDVSAFVSTVTPLVWSGLAPPDSLKRGIRSPFNQVGGGGNGKEG
ncbi:hypothetical protein MRB53_012374 [Persea americana]|uniref:Uncharacterized protein n=1 Tax=Persea americana TaxID=3435 RepID=A0ACC2LXG6_PERAE|nr:hypothetical protein MRB53_012374 [Persea americana]